MSQSLVVCLCVYRFDLSLISLILAYTHTKIYLITSHLLFVGFTNNMMFIQSCIVVLYSLYLLLDPIYLSVFNTLVSAHIVCCSYSKLGAKFFRLFVLFFLSKIDFKPPKIPLNHRLPPSHLHFHQYPPITY